jgi:hypothetical protein
MRHWVPVSRAPRGGLAAIAVTLSVVIGALAARGSWFADDLDLLVYGSKGFSPGVLFAPANDHVVPGLRFVFAVFAEIGRFDYTFTVVWRATVLCLNILLMGGLLYRLVGSSGWVLVGAACYGASPLMIPAFMQLSAGVNDVHAQLFALVLLHATLDWFAERRRWALVVAPLALALVLSFWLKAGLVVITAAALGWVVSRPTARRRVRDTLIWTSALCVPVITYAALILPRRRAGTARWPGWPVEGRLLWDSVRESVVPVFVGGPWTWTQTPPFGFAAPPVAAQVLGSLVVAALVVCTWRYRRPVMLMWLSVAAFTVATVLVVSAGRYFQFGDSLTRQYHYWSDLGIPMVIATVLTMDRVLPLPLDSSGGRAAGRGVRARLSSRPRLALATGSVWLIGCVVSHLTFAGLWGQNPAAAYFATIRTEIARSGSPPNIWDTPAPTTVAPFINEHRRLGEILDMAGLSVRLQQPDSPPRIFDDTGRLKQASFQTWALGKVPPNCAMRLLGAETLTIPLDHPLPAANWYVKLAYLANPDAHVAVELVDSRGGGVTPLSSHVEAWPSGLLTAYLNDPEAVVGKPADSVRLSSSAVDTSVCIGTTEVGLVVPAR